MSTTTAKENTMTDTMTNAERKELAQLARQRAKVAKAEILNFPNGATR